MQTPVLSRYTALIQFNEPGETCSNWPIPAAVLGTMLRSTPSDTVTSTSAAVTSNSG